MTTMTEPLYTRIGGLYECNECDVELLGFWEVSKHHWANHAWTRHVFQRVPGLT